MALDRLFKRWIGNRNKLDPEQFRKARPIRNPVVEWTTAEDGSLLMQVPIESRRKWLQKIAIKAKWPTTRQFELEPMGAFVWQFCDGQHSNETIARKLKERYKMNRLEAEASLSAFLQTLSQRGLISLLIGTKK